MLPQTLLDSGMQLFLGSADFLIFYSQFYHSKLKNTVQNHWNFVISSLLVKFDLRCYLLIPYLLSPPSLSSTNSPPLSRPFLSDTFRSPLLLLIANSLSKEKNKSDVFVSSRRLLKSIRDFTELSALTQEQLAKILEHSGNANLLWSFLHTKGTVNRDPKASNQAGKIQKGGGTRPFYGRKMGGKRWHVMLSVFTSNHVCFCLCGT